MNFKQVIESKIEELEQSGYTPVEAIRGIARESVVASMSEHYQVTEEKARLILGTYL